MEQLSGIRQHPLTQALPALHGAAETVENKRTTEPKQKKGPKSLDEVAQELYNKYGFHVAGRRLKYYSSDGEDAIIMSTDNIASMPFQASFQKLREAHAGRHPELVLQVD